MLFLTSPMAFTGDQAHDFVFAKPNTLTLRPRLHPFADLLYTFSIDPIQEFFLCKVWHSSTFIMIYS